MGKGFEFDGNGDYIDLGEPASLDVNFTQFTGSVWFKISNPAESGFFGKSIIWYLGLDGATQLKFRHYNVGDGTTHASVSNLGTTWHHMVSTFNGTNTGIYLDGVYVTGESAIEGGLGINNNGVGIGDTNTGGGTTFNGTIDDVMIFNRSLSASEISALYANTTSKYYSNNFTNLSVADHTFKAYAQDMSGNVNSTLERVVTITDTTAPDINITNPTPANASSQANTDIFVNISAEEETTNVSSFIDFDNSLVGWWRFDDVNDSGDVVDYMGRNNGSAEGDAVQTDAGYFGKGFEFDGERV